MSANRGGGRSFGADGPAVTCFQRLSCKPLEDGYSSSMMNRGDLNEMDWERLRPLFPPQKAWVGRPAKDHRRVLNGILWILRTGAPWRDLPDRYGKWTTVVSRFYRWRRAGIWDRLLTVLQVQGNVNGQLDWEKHDVDATVLRAHQHAAGAKGGARKPRASAAARAVSPRNSTFAPRAAASR